MKVSKIVIEYAVIAVALLAGTVSCTDFLERDNPTGVTDDDFWKTMNECESALGQVKSWIWGGYNGSSAPRLSYVCMEGMSDNMYFASNFKQEIVNLGNGSVTPTTSGYVSDVWKNDYIFIRRCNRFLENVGNAYFTDEKERERMIAEARTWRAWYHALLLMYYGWHDGIPIVDEALDPTEIYLPRNTVDECLDFINKELDDVIAITDDAIFPFVWDENRRDRMCKAYALVIKMDVNLQLKRYDVAKAAAKAIIDEGYFSLYYTTATDDDPGKNYRDLFQYTGQKNNERIIFSTKGEQDIFFRAMGTPLGGQGCFDPSKSLVDTYETINGKTLASLTAEQQENYRKNVFATRAERDPRLYATIYTPGDNTSLVNYTYTPFDASSSDYVGKTGASRSGYMVKKFISPSDRASTRGSLDFVIYRYAEVLLSYVECLVETGDWQNPDVAKYINRVRNRAGMPDMDANTYNSQEKVRELYRRERRVELAFEGRRYFDIRRWGIGPETMTGPVQGAWNPLSNAYVTIEDRACIFPKNDSWPLPQTEVTANENISQPTGW